MLNLIVIGIVLLVFLSTAVVVFAPLKMVKAIIDTANTVFFVLAISGFVALVVSGFVRLICG